MRAALLGLTLAACAANGSTAVPPAASLPPGGFRDEAVTAPVQRWVLLGERPVVNVSQTIDVATTEPFTQLIVKGIDGAPDIEQIEIEYADQGSRVVRLQRKLPAGEGQVIELRERRPIARLVVTTDPDAPGRYVILGG
jgi:hypothetical protein